MKGNDLACVVLRDHRVNGCEGSVNKEHPFGQKITGYPGCASIPPLRTGAPYPVGISVEGLKNMHTFLIDKIEIRQEDIAFFKDVVLHLDRYRTANIDRFYNLSLFRQYPHCTQADYLAARRTHEVRPFAPCHSALSIAQISSYHLVAWASLYDPASIQ